MPTPSEISAAVAQSWQEYKRHKDAFLPALTPEQRSTLECLLNHHETYVNYRSVLGILTYLGIRS